MCRGAWCIAPQQSALLRLKNITVWVDFASRIEEELDAKKCALVVVDVQHSFCSPDGRTGLKHSNVEMQNLPARINSFVDYFNKLGGFCVYLKSVPDETNSSATDKWLNSLKGVTRPANSQDIGLDLYGLEIPSTAIVLEKTGDGFSNSNLKSILDANGVEIVLVCGVRTEICVRRFAERCATEGYLVFVISDLCATRDDNYDHAEQALLFLNAYTGVVLDSSKMKQLFAR